jgi:excisionase family DNA binding protein
MAAYASPQRESLAREQSDSTQRLRLASAPRPASAIGQSAPAANRDFGAAVIEQLVDRVADLVAAAITERMTPRERPDDEWFDSLHAAEYLGVHRDTLRKLAAERAVPSEQDGPGCKLYFRRSDLDAWRRSGGRPRHLASSLASVA